MGVIFQSDAWASFQRSLGHEVIRSEGAGWSYLAVVMGQRTWRCLYCPYGPEASTSEAFDAALADLERTAREKHCWFVRGGPGADGMMGAGETPEEAFKRRGLRRPVGQGFTTHTQEIDLTQDENSILQGMEKANRKRHRNIHKKGVTFSCSTDPQDIEILLPLIDKLARERQFHRVSDNYLRQAAHTLMQTGAAALYIARLHGEPIGASLVYDWDGTRTYAHAAMDFEHRDLHAGGPLVVRMMLDAKDKGLSCFDLMAVSPEDAGPEDEWSTGFSTFKKRFGGRTVPHSGVWELPLARLRYAAYPTLLASRNKLIAGQRTAVRMMRHVRSGGLGSSLQ